MKSQKGIGQCSQNRNIIQKSQSTEQQTQDQQELESLKVSPVLLKGYQKTVLQAQSSAFMCLLVYFVMKGATLLIFYNYKTILNDNIALIIWFIILLPINAYYMLTTGKNPGYQTKKINPQLQKAILKQKVKAMRTQTIQKIKQLSNQHQQSTQLSENQSQIIPPYDAQLVKLYEQRYCAICKCLKRNRMKHCYNCGKCIMKQDHHCPWIGSCVGELNHFKFVLSLLFHTLQSSTTFYIAFQSLGLYKYYDQQENKFSSQFGILMMWSIFMFLYIMFAGGLLLFHFYLVASNLTTREMMSRRKCTYLKNVNGNPYDKGFMKNFQEAAFPQENGRQFLFYRVIDSGQFWNRGTFSKNNEVVGLKYGKISIMTVAEIVIKTALHQYYFTQHKIIQLNYFQSFSRKIYIKIYSNQILNHKHNFKIQNKEKMTIFYFKN